MGSAVIHNSDDGDGDGDDDSFVCNERIKMEKPPLVRISIV